MTDGAFLRLSDRWAISFDRLQWLVMQQKGRGRWKAVAFVASEKGCYCAFSGKKGVTPTPEAANALLRIA